MKEKEFYSGNGVYVLTNEEDVMNWFNSVTATTKQHSAPYAQDPRPQSGFKDLAEELDKFNGVGGIVNRKK